MDEQNLFTASCAWMHAPHRSALSGRQLHPLRLVMLVATSLFTPKRVNLGC